MTDLVVIMKWQQIGNKLATENRQAKIIYATEIK